MNRKGISQVLFLIIAASVLMMVALTLIFMFQSGAGDTTEQAQAQTCISSVEAQCSNFGSADVRAPTSCITNVEGQGQIVGGVPYTPYESSDITTPASGDLNDHDVHFDCSEVL